MYARCTYLIFLAVMNAWILDTFLWRAMSIRPDACIETNIGFFHKAFSTIRQAAVIHLRSHDIGHLESHVFLILRYT